MKIIIYNVDQSKFVTNFFEVHPVLNEDRYKPIDKIKAPRPLLNNESIEILEDSESNWVIEKKIKNGFYKDSNSRNFIRYYNSVVYPRNIQTNLNIV